MSKASSRSLEIALLVSAALREELETYPKPGLVSLVDNGSHPDMDATTFLSSIEAIEPFFARMAEAGAEECALRRLQEIGLQAEAAMREATGGRNTHRGAIFCLGLLAAAAGRRVEGSESLGAIVCRCWGGEIPQVSTLTGTSNGIVQCLLHGVGGVREEACLGFPSVFGMGLPSFLASVQKHGREAARVQAFFALLAVCEDTTLLKRGGPEGLVHARSEARRFLDCGGVANPHWRELGAALHTSFVEQNLTAGGAADLLSATLFVENADFLP